MKPQKSKSINYNYDAKAEVLKWSALFPEYKRVVDDIRCVLHGRDQRGGSEFHAFRSERKSTHQNVA
jgi:hypothetical protein